MTEHGNLRSWSWKRRYESPPDNLVDTFYVPAFARATTYDRAVGFFSSGLLAIIAPAIDEFVIRGGRMRLITSPANLSDSDLYAMGKGEDIRERLRQDLVSAVAAPVSNATMRDRLSLLCWMIATEHLDVRIALRELPDSYALFHEKIGVFRDAEGNWMTFTGSPNETGAAALRHSESFPLHTSWANDDQRAYASEERDRFDGIWEGSIDGIHLWSATEWIAEPMRKAFGARRPLAGVVPKSLESGQGQDLAPFMVNELSLLPSMPPDLILHEYQRDAVNAWLESEPNGRGIFAMATGVGKTITALTCATRLVGLVEKANRPLLVVTVVPSVDLVRQWTREAERFGWHPAVYHGQMSQGERTRLREVFASAGMTVGRRAEMVITTVDSFTLSYKAFASGTAHTMYRQISENTGFLMVMADEVHSLGTAARLESLPENAAFRLGLSATPKRHGDEEGTEALVAYFGPTVASIDLKEAIYRYGALVEYDYHPERVELAVDEMVAYRELAAKIARAYAAKDDDAVERYIRQRTRLVQHASGKLGQLRALMQNGLRRESRQIIYVAEGNDPQTELNQLSEVGSILTTEFGMKVARYVGETDSTERAILQKQLANGDVQALIAMKCLDEGVDIPSARIGVLMASTQNPRQFVQRRGRLLRQDPSTAKTHAEIYDFLVLPPPDPSGGGGPEKTLIGAELSRAVELADAARNSETRYTVIAWAYEYSLDPQRFTWMKLQAGDEMEAWTS